MPEKSPWTGMRLLRWATILLPALYVGILVFLHYRYLDPFLSRWLGRGLSLWVWIGMTLVGVGVAAYFFSRTIFDVISHKESEVLRRNEELSAVNSVSLAVSQSLDLDTVLTQALDRVLQVTDTEVGEIFLREEETGDMVRRVHVGPFAQAFSQKTRFKPGEGFPGLIAETGRAEVTTSLQEDPRFLRDEVKRLGFAFFAGIPLKSGNSVVGVMDVAGRKRRPVIAEELRLLEAIGHQVGTAVEKARLYDRVQSLAILEERERIAREMHDGLAQVLGYVNTKAQAAQEYLARDQVSQAQVQLQELGQVAQEVYADLREAILGLRLTLSPGRSLLAALKEYLERFSQQSHIQADLVVEGEDGLPPLPQVAEVQVIRIIQEAMTNVRKHAQATKALVSLVPQGPALEITVADDGRGFDPARLTPGRHLGLQTMRERAQSISGSLDIDSAPGQGTRVSLHIPLDGHQLGSSR